MPCGSKMDIPTVTYETLNLSESINHSQDFFPHFVVMTVPTILRVDDLKGSICSNAFHSTQLGLSFSMFVT